MAFSDGERRAYWTAQLDEAHGFMFDSIFNYPVQECGETLVALPDACTTQGVEVLFADAKHVDNLDRLFYLREGQIPGFLAAARDMNRRGWIMRVEDGYRTRAIQKGLGRLPVVFDAVLRTEIVRTLVGSIGLVASVPKFATHMSGSAIDISVVHRDEPDREVDRGAPYVEMSELTPMGSPFISAQAQQNRRGITALMRRHGFVEYPFEFWHYSSGDAYDQYLRRTGKPAIYGAIEWDPVSNSVKPIADLYQPLNSNDEVRAGIEAALTRLPSRQGATGERLSERP